MSWIQEDIRWTPYSSGCHSLEFMNQQHSPGSWHNMASAVSRRRQRHMRRKLPPSMDINSTILQDILMGNVPYSYAHLMAGGSRIPVMNTPIQENIDLRMSFPCVLGRGDSKTVTMNHGSYFQNLEFSIHKKRTPMFGCKAVVPSDVGSQITAVDECYEQSEPIDLSSKNPSNPRPSSAERRSLNDFSLLRYLLLADKNTFKEDINTTESTASEMIDNDRAYMDGNARVVLAKKNMFPVTARVTDWLVEIVHFLITSPDFLSLSINDQVTLLIKSWARLLILYMAETNFQFAFTISPDSSSGKHENICVASPHIPTVKCVKVMQNVIRKCHLMKMDEKEYSCLRMVVIFNEGIYY